MASKANEIVIREQKSIGNRRQNFGQLMEGLAGVCIAFKTLAESKEANNLVESFKDYGHKMEKFNKSMQETA
jgi:hypothetical protein